MATRCLGTNQSGGPCGGYVPKASTWCLWHDPDRESEREEWRRRGGENRSNKARARKKMTDQVMSINDLDAFLCASMTRVAAGRMEPNVGSAVATLAKTVVAIRTAGELERRLEELERRAGMARMGRIGG